MINQITTVPITIETRQQLKELAKHDNRSVIRYLEVKVKKDHKKIFCPKISETITRAI